ncbi:MAG TPA: hypothetical protein VLL52_12115 [Anaerolineae bacterium]|nr:hypothetical protein [Anaerolineae bacterium]
MSYLYKQVSTSLSTNHVPGTSAHYWAHRTESDHDPALLAEITVRLGESGLFGLTGQVATEADISFRPFNVTE